MSYGTSGTRMYSAPPQMPAYKAISPHLLPITLTSETLSCEVIVSRRALIAHRTVLTAVSKPSV